MVMQPIYCLTFGFDVYTEYIHTHLLVRVGLCCAWRTLHISFLRVLRVEGVHQPNERVDAHTE